MSTAETHFKIINQKDFANHLYLFQNYIERFLKYFLPHITLKSKQIEFTPRFEEISGT